MEKSFIKIHQDSLILYIVSFLTGDLLDMTEIEHYNSDTTDGYQRPPVPSHFKKIAKYLGNDQLPVLPTAILTAIDPSQILERGSVIKITGKLRVVDGQHRIEGIKYLQITNPEGFNRIKQYEFPVVIMAVTNDMKELEINTFININSTAKRVSTDLACELREKIIREKISKLQQGDTLPPEQCEGIATQIARRLNGYENCIWFDSIRLGDELSVAKPLSITAFSKSIKEIVSIISKGEIDLKGSFELINKTTDLIISTWNEVKHKWPECFEESIDTFNIKKGIGVFSLHLILKECVTNSNGNINKALDEFKRILNRSQALYTDWMTGGKFTGMSSGQAIKRISAYIKNEVNKEDF